MIARLNPVSFTTFQVSKTKKAGFGRINTADMVEGFMFKYSALKLSQFPELTQEQRKWKADARMRVFKVVERYESEYEGPGTDFVMITATFDPPDRRETEALVDFQKDQEFLEDFDPVLLM